jgi:hypothetical protein
MQGPPFTEAEKIEILEYSKGDVNAQLLSEMLPLLGLH